MILVFLAAIPKALTIAIPLAVAVTSLLVFERVSGDMEVTAMKACGVSMWQIASRPLMFAVLLTSLCLYLEMDLGPACHNMWRNIVHKYSKELARVLWEPGKFVRPPTKDASYWVYVESSEHDETTDEHRVKNIIIYVRRRGEPEREIRAAAGTVQVSSDGSSLTFRLRGDVRIDPAADGAVAHLSSVEIPIDTSKGPDERRSTSVTELSGAELISRLLGPAKGYGEIPEDGNKAAKMVFAVELNQRIVRSLTCIAFALLGIPLGTMTLRFSQTIGKVVRMLTFFVIVFAFYVAIVLVDRLAETRPEFRPDLIVWAPVIVSMGLGVLFLWRTR